MGTRKIKKLMKAVPTMEGAGVHLKRVFGFHEAPELDPFLLLDDFHSDDPDKYLMGFPWHPHRGIETITYLLQGDVEHGDSMGNKGVIGEGDVQWMTAGSGIIHQEMPLKVSGDMRGLQLWVNLPASHKMMDPRYRDIPSATIPMVMDDNGVEVRIVAGKYNGVSGPMEDLVQAPSYFDVAVPVGEIFTCDFPEVHTVFAYVLSGKGRFAPGDDNEFGAEHLVLYGEGDLVSIGGGDTGVRFLLIAGEPLGEPVAWGGPIVMNTEEELKTAFREYREGTFIKVGQHP